MSNPFVHLHTHSEYSLLDGLGRIKDLVAEAKRLGQPALALTDHGVMHGAVEFFRAARSAGVQPIIGVEAYQTVWGRPMQGRDPRLDKENYHLLLLARNMTGYRNLLKISSYSHLDGYYYKPRVDHEFLAQHAAGLIATTGCLGAEIPQLISQGKEEEAYQRLGWYVDVFGKDHFFIELQEHNIPELREVNKVLVPWAKKFGLGLVVTNDVHYVRREDASPHEVLLCVQTGTKLSDEKRMRMSDGSYYLKSRAELEEVFRPLLDLPASAFDNTLVIAEMCQEVDLEDPNYHLPDIEIPEGFTYETYLRHLTEEGLRRRYGERADDPEVQERKERELRIIHEMGFDVYFLIVADLCNYARSKGIWWNVRGSGAGSLVAYCIGITNLDPLKNNLIFERFLNPGRVTMPDFDLDFPDDQREEMIRYTIHKYGSDQVAQIVTFGRMKARAAVRDVGRVKDIPLADVDRIAKLIPAIPGKPVTIKDVLTPEHEFYNPELAELYEKQAWVRDLLDTAMQLEGVARHSGIHAAAVIVADRELVHYTPLMRGTKGAITEAITQYEFPILESIGLLKVDFLGLSTLTVLREACRLIKERHGVSLGLDNIPFEGEAARPAFELLSSGEVSGVFQVESQGMRRVLTEMRPSAFEHIVATISLYRPGPLEYIPQFIRRMHGEEKVEFKHPALAPILAETYGICVSGDALVMDARTGRRYRLDELADVKGMLIQGVDADWQPAVGRVTHWIDSGVKPVYRVRLRNGAEIKVTADHRLLGEDGWRPLAELKVGDHVAVPKSLFGPEESPRPVDRRRLRILAYLLADGSLASGPSVDFVSKDPALIQEYLRCLEAFPDVEPRFVRQVRGVTRVGVAKRAGSGHYHQPNSLLAWMREIGLKHPAGARPGGLRSHEKRIPDQVFELGTEDLAFFLASLWDCDGYAGRKLWHYKTVSAAMARDVQTLLLRLGIQSTIYANEYPLADGKRRTGYQVTVYDTARLAALLRPHMVTEKQKQESVGQATPTLDRASFIREVDAVWSGSYRELMAVHGIDRQHFYARNSGRPRISARVAAALAEQLPLPETRRRLGVIWEPIVAIEYVGEEHVYDLTVEGLHSFVANNIVVHNCVYQEQIIQILSQLAGYTPGDADLVRRAISKKKKSEIDKHREIFIQGCAERGIPAETAASIYDDIEYFARYGFNKCLPGDVEVVDAASGRLVRVADLFTGRATIQETLACDTGSLKLRTARVAQVQANGVKPVYRLTTRLGRQIEATANHPFYTFEGWRLLAELRPGDLIATPRQIPVEGQEVWPEHYLIALGHLLAEGNLCHPRSVYFYSRDREQIADYIRAAEQFDNVACTVADHRGTLSVYARRVQRDREPGLVTWIKELGLWGCSARDKFIPEPVFTLRNDQIALLLARMWEGDGHINAKGRSLFYATASGRMARQMQHLLLRLGIISSLRTVTFPYKDGRTGYQLFVTGQENFVRFARQIGIHFISPARRNALAALAQSDSSQASVYDVVPLAVKEQIRAAKQRHGITWKTLREETGVAPREFYPTNNPKKNGFTRETIRRLADYWDDPDLKRLAESDLYWDAVETIEYVGEKETYDLTVPDLHNFVANDILVHNSHAADYAVITVQTAYLKALYPVEYMAALLLVERDKTEKVVNFLHECRRMGIRVLPPDVNYSGLDFEIQDVPEEANLPPLAKDPSLAYDFPVPEGAAIRFGMAAVKNVGEGPVQVILQARREGGPFTSLEDFCDRVDLRQVNRRALECLIKVGALDRFGERNQLLEAIDQMMARSAATHSARDSGQLSMFDLMGGAGEPEALPIRLPDVKPATGRERLGWEKELLGMFASSHPLQQIKVDLDRFVTCSCAELGEQHDGQPVTVAGLIADIRVTTTKKGDRMAFIQLEDLQGHCEVVLFPRTYAEVKDLLELDRVVLVKGKAQTRGNRTSVLADTLQTAVQFGVEVPGEDPGYQQRLLDAPRINGVPVETTEEPDGDEFVREAATPYSVGPRLPEPTPRGLDALDADEPFYEENPFADEMPDWMLAEMAEDEEEEPEGTKEETPHVPDVAQTAASVTPEPTSSPGPSEAPSPAEPVPPPDVPPVASATSVQTSSEPRPGHRRNGHSRGQGRLLRITFTRTGHLDRDKYRLKEIVNTVRDPRGRDRFEIVLRSEGRSHALFFPNDYCTITPRLLDELRTHFRVDVQVDETD